MPQSTPPRDQGLTLPQMFGRYLLIQRLSRGGMGEIFLAKHGLAGFEKLAVIKKILSHLAADRQFISRFADEAQVAIKLSHINVAQVFEVGRVGDEYFLALEYIDGRDLRRTQALLGGRKQRLPIDLALFIAREIANGLAYAHRRTTSAGAALNLVHCDISPPNVLVSFEGETKVIDFGIAKTAMRAAPDPKVAFGKFGYMAPEQLVRGGILDHRTDLYAAGVVLFELLTGTRLYEPGRDPDYRALARKVARGEHRRPSEVDPRLAAYDDLVATALRPLPADRYQSAAEMRDAIQQRLIAVNPTISTDQLGAYMRDLFGDEMAAHCELHERAASARLRDFQGQLRTPKPSTVSFAFAHLPLPRLDTTGSFGRSPSTQATAVQFRAAQPNPVVVQRSTASIARLRPSPALDTTAPPTDLLGAMPRPDELAPLAKFAPRDPGSALATAEPVVMAAPVRPVGRWRVRVRPRSVAIMALATLSLCVLAALNGSIPPTADLTAGHESAIRADATASSQRAIANEPVPAGPVSNEPVSTEPVSTEPIPTAKTGAADEIVRKSDEVDRASAAKIAKVAQDNAAQPTRRMRPLRRQFRKDAKPAQAPPAPFTREQLSQTFQQIRREYDHYKSKFGSRLEREWGDLANLIQYMPTSDDAERKEAAHKLEAFRLRMRE